MLGWVNRFSIFCFLDNQHYAIEPHTHDCLLGAGARTSINTGDLAELDAFLSQQKGWLFGHLSYDLKESIHGLPAPPKNRIAFPPAFFFQPEILLRLNGDQLNIQAANPDNIYQTILSEEIKNDQVRTPIVLQQKLTREAYLNKLHRLQQHIVRGDCYEINFCQEFFAEDALIDPVTVFQQLAARSPNPFCAFYRWHDQYLICASPERYLLKKGRRLLSQPMKGTIARDVNDPQHDEQLKEELRKSAKDQSENVMVVDLVRNDLSRVCREGTVKTEELFGIYTYPQVHQMISTIVGELRPETSFSDIIRATFPMGSMTGAPKHRVMELIDTYETSARGIFSGAVGYIDPSGDFDLNVVIRSIMYNAADRYLSYQVGSGITFYSNPEAEWEECLLKGQAMRNVLEGK
jgi:para-aminobenzoate synthetase component 1